MATQNQKKLAQIFDLLNISRRDREALDNIGIQAVGTLLTKVDLTTLDFLQQGNIITFGAYSELRALFLYCYLHRPAEEVILNMKSEEWGMIYIHDLEDEYERYKAMVYSRGLIVRNECDVEALSEQKSKVPVNSRNGKTDTNGLISSSSEKSTTIINNFPSMQNFTTSNPCTLKYEYSIPESEPKPEETVIKSPSAHQDQKLTSISRKRDFRLIAKTVAAQPGVAKCSRVAVIEINDGNTKETDCDFLNTNLGIKPIVVTSSGHQSDVLKAQSKKNILLQVKLLIHAVNSAAPCPAPNCGKLKGFLEGGSACQEVQSGFCVCKRFSALLQACPRQV